MFIYYSRIVFFDILFFLNTKQQNKNKKTKTKLRTKLRTNKIKQNIK